MKQEVPAWVAVVVIVVIVLIVAAIYVFSGTIRPRGVAGPTPEHVKQKMQQSMLKMKGQMMPGPGGYGAYGGHGVYGIHRRLPSAAQPGGQ